jgi:thiol-disulfide isomerase/thioredoxin
MSARRKPTRPSSNRTRRAARRRSSRPWWIAGGVAAVVLIALLAALVAGGSTSSSDVRSPAPPALVDKVASIPPRVFDAVGVGQISAAPKKIVAPPLSAAGKPLVLYVGAEYCPYCAAERWPTVIALSRFGTFSGLQLTKSASNDVFANTPTFSFHGATYQSKYVTLQAVELKTRTGGQLDSLTPEQQQIVATYDAPPYTSKAGSIPFIDFGGRYLISGATYDPSVLSGKTADEIATLLSDPNSAVAKGVLGAANTITAAVCDLTRNQPATVCADPVITDIRSRLG